MNMDSFVHLLRGYLDNNLTEEEYMQFCKLLEDESVFEQLPPELKELWDSQPAQIRHSSAWDDKMRSLIHHQNPKGRPKSGFLRYAAAAVVFFSCLALSYSILYPKFKPGTSSPTSARQYDIDPGSDGAILSFSNGKVVWLDTAQDGILMDGVEKSRKYLKISQREAQYATLTTPRAKQQRLVLSDGTRIWLNAASTIRFPSVFNGGKRVVELSGEAYFEVAKDAAKPFVVKMGQNEINVLGTRFNVMSYDNESKVVTTLLEGAVKYSTELKTVVLKPGQETRAGKDGSVELVKNADMELATAWKNGQQMFKRSDLTSIMRQVERWYNVDVVFKNEAPKTATFTGDLPRDVGLIELLKVFEQPNLHFEVDAERRIITVTE